MLKDFFINLSIFSFFVSAAIVFQVFTTSKGLKSSYLLGGCYASIVAVILMFFPIRYNEFLYDLRFVPIILSFVYFGHRAGWMTAIGICIAHVYIGGYWITGVVILGGTIFLFILLESLIKNLPSIKRAFFYLAIHFVVYSLIVETFSDASATMYFHIAYYLFVLIGLLIGIFLIEAFHKLHRLTQDLSRLNQTLAESRQELKDTVHEQQGGIFKFKKENESFIITLCDGQLYAKSGVYLEQVTGKDLNSVAPLHFVPRLLKYYQRAWEGHEVTFELPWPNDKIYIFISLRPIKREGKVIEVVGSAIDITERKKMEEELRMTKERLESFISHNTDAIIISDLKGHILQANKAYEKMLGWSIQEIKGQTLPCVPDFLIDRAFETIQKIISGESITTKLETVRQRKDGSLFNISLTLSPIVDSKGNVIAISTIYRDISERKKVKRELHHLHQQLKESEMKYRVLVEHLPDAVYLVELNEDRYPSRLLEVNPVGCERFGYSREELLSMPYADIVPQNSTMFIKIVEKISEGKCSFTLEDEFVFKKTGKKINTEFNVRVFNLNGKEVLLLISRDITERLKTEELLRKSEKLAVVGQLATAIAHQVNNPLTAMKGFMQLLKLTENENNQRYIDVVLSEMNRIEGITNEYLTIAKPQAVKIQLNDLHMLVDQVITLFQPQATMNNIQIRSEFESAIPLVACEGNQLKQVFINILKNAIEAMPIGGDVLIQVNKLDDHQVCIRFIDQGCGIPKERIPHLGEPFYSIKEKGIGLGLMVCYKIIEAHQGKIVIESEMNKGTTIDVILPFNLLSYQEVH
ncbi:PAS domain S-box protein [Metabacillus sediminilitoris]|uniref:histidine kinase n=1 Tax=Metabacillus sediminilitoris TaxID=2567941 RepID=A0A4S4C341_9BACI|nr:PAS domain S-box protein [Metabacillus sediminilitoris]QGQ48138.1 PAS domain S-box protein [Metabacillus sediminilitoris]THF81499.1 PAS domain S-box protein [Metabacillus sediminilitoris]